MHLIFVHRLRGPVSGHSFPAPFGTNTSNRPAGYMVPRSTLNVAGEPTTYTSCQPHGKRLSVAEILAVIVVPRISMLGGDLPERLRLTKFEFGLGQPFC